MLNAKQQQRQEKENYWRPHLEAWQKSQNTMVAYCKEHELNIDHFRYWNTQLYRIQQPEVPLSFTEMKVNLQGLNTTGFSMDILLTCDTKSLCELFRERPPVLPGEPRSLNKEQL